MGLDSRWSMLRWNAAVSKWLLAMTPVMLSDLNEELRCVMEEDVGCPRPLHRPPRRMCRVPYAKAELWEHRPLCRHERAWGTFERHVRPGARQMQRHQQPCAHCYTHAFQPISHAVAGPWLAEVVRAGTCGTTDGSAAGAAVLQPTKHEPHHCHLIVHSNAPHQ